MCLTKTQDQPVMTGAGPLNPDDPSSGTLSANGAQTTVPVKMPTKMGRAAEIMTGGGYDPTGGEDTTSPPTSGPTKFGALMKILGPAMHGAAIGGFLGKSHPGGGFGAANDFYMQQRMRQMQMAEFMQQMQLQQSTIAKNQAEAQWAQRRPLLTRTGPTIKGKDAQGNSIVLSQNPNTGQYEPVDGVTPDGAPAKEVSTDQGLVTYDPTNPQKGAVPLTMAQQAVTSEPSTLAAKTPTKFNSGSPRVPGTASQSPSPAASPAATAIPLHGPNFRKPKPAIRASRNAAGVETDNVIDENPDSPTFGQTIKKTGITREPVPDKTRNRKVDTEGENAQIETYAAEALKRSGNDPDKAIQFMNGLKTGDKEADKKLQAMLPKIRQHIRDRMKQGKKRLTLSPEDAKAAGLTPTQNSSVVDEEEEQPNP